MSRFSFILSLALTITLTFAGLAVADKAASDEGLKQGDPLGVFYVTKIAGAIDDAVEPGEELCYRCRYGSRPMVLVFARDIGGQVPELLQAIDKAVAENEDSRLQGLLTLIGDDATALKGEAEKIAETAGDKLVPVVIAKETKTGPLSYKLSSDAEVTIILAQDSQVVATHTFDASKIDVQAIISEATRMLN